jgi:hypothetical protein
MRLVQIADEIVAALTKDPSAAAHEGTFSKTLLFEK